MINTAGKCGLPTKLKSSESSRNSFWLICFKNLGFLNQLLFLQSHDPEPSDFFHRTELMRRMKRYQIANYKCLVVKYAKDNRYDKEGIATHDRYVLLWNKGLWQTDIKTFLSFLTCKIFKSKEKKLFWQMLIYTMWIILRFLKLFCSPLIYNKL